MVFSGIAIVEFIASLAGLKSETDSEAVAKASS